MTRKPQKSRAGPSWRAVWMSWVMASKKVLAPEGVVDSIGFGVLGVRVLRSPR